MWKNESGQDICLNADKSKVVNCNSAEAAFLLVGPGGQLPDDEAKKYGLAGKAKASESAPAAEADEESGVEAKAVEKPAENKAVTKAPAMKAKG